MTAGNMSDSEKGKGKEKGMSRRTFLELALLVLAAAACEPESPSTPVATRPSATSTVAPTLAPTLTVARAEPTPTIGPNGELLIGAEFSASGGSIESSPFIYKQERTRLPSDIPSELIAKYGFVANSDRETGQVAIAPDGTEYFIPGQPPTINGKGYDNSSSRPGLGVFAYESGLYLPGLIETNPDSQYFLASEKSSSGKIVMIVRNQNGKYLVLDDRDPTLPGTQEWLLKAPKGANISIQAGKGGFITIGETTYSTSLPELKPISEVFSADDCPLYTKDQILASPIGEQPIPILETAKLAIASDSITIVNPDNGRAIKILGCAKINFGPEIGDKIVAKIAITGTKLNDPTIFYGVSLSPADSFDQELAAIKSPNLRVEIRTSENHPSVWAQAAAEIIEESDISVVHQAGQDYLPSTDPNAKAILLQAISTLEGKLAPVWFDSY